MCSAVAGSIVPTLVRQIDAGGPITITHPDARRFFMTLSEAASLVLLSSVLGAPGGVFVLEMGEDVRVIDLAERVVRLKGLRLGRDVAVQVVGLRPGEKLREELCTADETLAPTVESRACAASSRAWSSTVGCCSTACGRSTSSAAAGALHAADYSARLRELIEAALSRTGRACHPEARNEPKDLTVRPSLPETTV